MSGSWVCDGCGTRIPGDDTVCRRCGTGEPGVAGRSSGTGGSLGPVWGIGCLILVIGGIASCAGIECDHPTACVGMGFAPIVIAGGTLLALGLWSLLCMGAREVRGMRASDKIGSSSGLWARSARPRRVGRPAAYDRLVCRSCGDPTPHGAVCRWCGEALVDTPESEGSEGTPRSAQEIIAKAEWSSVVGDLVTCPSCGADTEPGVTCQWCDQPIGGS